MILSLFVAGFSRAIVGIRPEFHSTRLDLFLLNAGLLPDFLRDLFPWFRISHGCHNDGIHEQAHGSEEGSHDANKKPALGKYKEYLLLYLSKENL